MKMELYSERAIKIINELHTERLDYESEYVPLIDAANTLKEFERSGHRGRTRGAETGAERRAAIYCTMP